MPASTVLIVEDHEYTRQVISVLFQRRNWQVRTAETTAAGLAALDPVPDAVLIDLMLPDGEGESILEKIRAENLPVRVVVVATGTNDPARLAKVAELRPHLMIKKPFDWEIVRRYCEGEMRRVPKDS